MHPSSRRIGTFAIVLALLAGAAASAQAHEFKVGPLVIGHPWSRQTPGGAKIGGGYLTVTNTGTETDRLLGGSVGFADHVEIHEMKMNDGVMTMRPLADGVDIKPGETVTFAPGGYHLMFMDLKQPLKKDDMLKGELQFQKAGKVAVEFKVEAVGAAGPGGAAGGGDMSGHKH
jgi:hypothetical protein